MGVPATLADLDSIAANNSPSGSDPIGTNLDDYLRSHAAMIKQAATVIPSGTRMPFAQANAPTGWTQDTSDNATNRMLRVVNTAAHTVGGSHSPILNNVVPWHNHEFTTGNESADHSHIGTTGIESAQHTHAAMLSPSGSFVGGPNFQGGSGYGWNSPSGTQSANHTHTFTTGGRSVAHTHSGTSNANAAAANWTPRYIDMIICSKN